MLYYVSPKNTRLQSLTFYIKWIGSWCKLKQLLQYP